MKGRHGAVLGGVRYWWQDHPMAGLTIGWIAIGLLAWRLYTAFFGHTA
ncbi:MAG: hypothetical protein J7521_11480 [Caulobacter sp.]|nr:hypothetical protein [Caulobacter sp.]